MDDARRSAFRPRAFAAGRAAIAVALSAALAVSGCASLLNPYVRAKELDAKVEEKDIAPPLLGKALNEAIAQRAAYYDAVSDRAKLRNSLPLILIPLTAYTLYRGATVTTQGGRNTVLELGLLGAAIFGLGSYYTVGPRERIHLAGALAVSCSIHAVSPFIVPPTEYEAFLGNLAELDAALRAVEQQRQQIELALRAAPSAEDARAVAQSGSIVERARETRDAGVRLRATLDRAAWDLRWATERIVNQVGVQIEASEPDPGSVLRIVGSLGPLAGQLVPVPSVTGALERRRDVAAVQAGDPLAEDLRKLRALVDDLTAKTARVAAFVNARNEAIRSAPKLDACTEVRVATEFQVLPDVAEIELRPGQVRQFLVRSGAGIPGADLVGLTGSTAAPAVRLVKTVQGNVLVVEVQYVQAVEGIDETTLEFSDAARGAGRKSVRVRLAPGAAPAPAQPAPAPAHPADAFERTLKPPDIERIQRLVGLTGKDVDGKLGPVTRAAIAADQKARKFRVADGRITQDYLDELAKPKPAPGSGAPAPGTAAPEPALDTAAVEALQRKLGVSATGKLDDETRRAVRRFKQTTGIEPVDDRLDQKTIDAILKPS